MPARKTERSRVLGLRLGSSRRVPFLLALVALGLLVAACAGDSEDSETASDGNEAPLVENGSAAGEIEDTPEPTSADAASDGSRPFPNVEQGQARISPSALDPGVYRTTVFGPALTLSVGEGWTQLDEFEPLLLLSRTLGTRQVDALNFVFFPGLDVEQGLALICSDPVICEEPVPASVGGAEGFSVHAEVSIPGGGSEVGFEFPNNEIYSKVDLDPPVFIDGDLGRDTVVDVEGGVLVILAGSDPDRVDVDEFFAEVDKVLATVEFS